MLHLGYTLGRDIFTLLDSCVLVILMFLYACMFRENLFKVYVLSKSLLLLVYMNFYMICVHVELLDLTTLLILVESYSRTNISMG